ncbi:MAG: bifunctional metallophosphatase/5'-nucleotidase [Woeseiaceae bacterium]
MQSRRQHSLLVLVFLAIGGCQPATESPAPAPSAAAEDTMVTLLFTNDVESAYDPIPAFWLDDIATIGGIAEMTTLIENLRESEPNVFLFDSGDIFTGALAKLTEGKLAFELMMTMGYDAMAIGNHEFEYGHKIFEWEKNRAPFPVLGANFFYKDTEHPYAQAHTIIERNGIRIGVIGIMGQDAATAIIPSYIAPLDVRDPATLVQKSVAELRDQVDLIVLLTHQGKTAPMQTDAESDPRLQRDIDADIALAGAVDGIDILLAGHADAGTPEPVVHPQTGTLIMQTYGQATHLGFLQLRIDGSSGEISDYEGRLIPVESDKLVPDSRIMAKLQKYRTENSEIMVKVGTTAAPMIRRYIEESDIGNLFADIFVAATDADIGFVHGGSLRKDLPAGDVRLVDILDSYPFVDDVNVKEMRGSQIRRAIEQSLTFERGLLQLSGLEVSYDLDRPKYSRILTLEKDGQAVADDDLFTVAAPGFLTEGGDLYDSFPESEVIQSVGKVSDVVIDYFRSNDVVAVPPRGRQFDRSGN